jgi:RHS repeat-associated protein
MRVGQADGSFWLYQYDSLGQVISGKKYWQDWTPVAGQQFEYAFDDIGNRNSTKAGGDQTGMNLRSATYSVNDLNQYTNRTVPGAVDIIGVANAAATVTVNNQSTYRKSEYYRKELSINNASAPQWQSVTNKAVQSGTTNTTTGNVFLPKTPEPFIYDADGNLLSDGRWTNSWDAENRLITMQGLSTLPTAARQKLDFEYDWQSRRIRKTVSNWNGTQFVAASTNRFVYDGWNLVIDANPSNVPQRRYMWGLDLSGTEQGAGGVGGLLAIQDVAGGTGVHFAAFDGNGNVAALVKANDGTLSATYEYGPFGEVIRASGAIAKGNPFRFSTKYQDDESDFLYYGYRYYNPSVGKWIGRDPADENGGANLYVLVANSPLNDVDGLGLAGVVIQRLVPPLNTSNCGGAVSEVHFLMSWISSIDKVPDGWIIQHIKFEAYVEDCKGRRVRPSNPDGLEYWEAWKVKNGVVYVGDTSTLHVSDRFQTADEGTGYKGSIQISGRVTFLQGYKLTYPPWKTGSFTGISLPTVTRFPGWNDSGADDHILTVKFNCCCPKKGVFGTYYTAYNPEVSGVP